MIGPASKKRDFIFYPSFFWACLSAKHQKTESFPFYIPNSFKANCNLFFAGADTLPGGAVGGGMMTSFSQKAKPIGYLINIASCEAGYYAGVYATEYALNLMK